MRAADHELVRYRLLASAVAGRFVDVAPVDEEPGPTWTDGATIFADANAKPRDVQCAIVVQASLLASGSLAPDVVAKLGRRASVARRYLTLEGHRALAAQHDLLPAAARALVDADIAARSASPEASLRLALGGEAIAEPPARFGAIRPRRLRSSIERPGVAGRSADAARAEQALEEFDERVDDDAPVVDVGSTSVGRGGAIGRRLKQLFTGGRPRAAGAAGAAPPTHWTRRTGTPRGSRPAAQSSASTVPADVGLV
jgi:hypothetical protein